MTSHFEIYYGNEESIKSCFKENPGMYEFVNMLFYDEIIDLAWLKSRPVELQSEIFSSQISNFIVFGKPTSSLEQLIEYFSISETFDQKEYREIKMLLANY